LVAKTRQAIEAVLDGADRRLLVIVGPCSIHDPASALEYAQRLCRLRARLADELLICMRVYLEKPRTALGWKGLINDPHLDGRCDIETGLRTARTLLLDLAELGVPAATETLDPVASHYLSDLVSWTAIGARTTESQTHRELASGLAMPVGFKNGTDGGLEAAINAITTARAAHSHLGIDGAGRLGVVRTSGNRHTHLVLRGGGGRPNYREPDVRQASEALLAAGLDPRMLIDCSHGNSGKNPDNQRHVMAEVSRQLEAGSERVLGVMLESHLVAGRQELIAGGAALRYGQSITDACIDFDTTEALLVRLAGARGGARSRTAGAQMHLAR
jgi:3-deoxy-7-phosphoheptulonate synthase